MYTVLGKQWVCCKPIDTSKIECSNTVTSPHYCCDSVHHLTESEYKIEERTKGHFGEQNIV